MFQFSRFIRNKENIVLLFTAVVTVGYITFLLSNNYVSQKKVREATLIQLRQQVEKRAADLGYFSEDLMRDIHNLANSGKLSLFFENKALGMSMEYGLRSTIMTIAKSFERFTVEKRIGSQQMFSRLVFIDQNANLLVDTARSGLGPSTNRNWSSFLSPGVRGWKALVAPDNDIVELIFCTPFYFKNSFHGQIIAWILAENVFEHFFSTEDYKSGKFYLALGNEHFLTAGSQTHKIELPLSSGKHITLLNGLGHDEVFSAVQTRSDTLSFRVPIRATPFILIETIPGRAVFGSTSPRTLLLALGLLTLAVLGFAAFVFRMITHNRILHIRVEESQKKEKEIERKNLELKREIEERKRSEQKRIKLEAQLQRAQKMEAIGTLAGGVAHDLNNMLSGIVSYPDLLLMDLPPDSPLRSSVMAIKESGEKAAAIVQDMLHLARRAVTVKEVINLNDVINDYLKSPQCAKLKTYHPQVQISTHLEEKPLNIMGSPVHLSKTIMNLVSNAAEAMHEGGQLHVATENCYVDKPINGYDKIKEGEYLLLKVTDTGTGIPPEDLDKIYEPFYTKKVMGRSGTGLGMTVVWGTVADHNGYIDVQSAQGQGTTFNLYLPATRREGKADLPHLTLEDFKGKGEAILVVDDVQEQRDIASQILAKLGYTANTVPSGEDALKYLSEHSADLLVLDMIMDPGIDGLETYKEALRIRPGQKAIIVSGFSETHRVKEAQRLGAGEYVKKPYTLEKMGLAVRNELNRLQA